MQLYPTRNAVHVATAGIAVVGAGLAFSEPAVLAWGGALLVGLAIARAVTLLGVARVRSAGFEMLWRESGRSRRIGRGQMLELAAEVRNRDTRAARYVALRAVASPDLELEISPTSGEVPAGGRLAVAVKIRAPRVGRHGIFGLSLEVQGSPGLFEIPLTFANPFGIEVVPVAHSISLRTARGGRSRARSEAGRTGPLSGDGYELREIREHRSGDALKRVAWKASARRGRLMVKDFEQEERDVVWLVVDASVELWAGRPGHAPLDHAIEEAAAVAEAHHVRGDYVGLAICGGRVLASIRPGWGAAHLAELMAALSNATGTLDSDRSGLDAADVAARVLEHLKPLDPALAAGVTADEREKLVQRALSASGRAPFAPLGVHGTDPADRVLRGYLSSFGIASPPRLEPDRPRTDETLAEVLMKLPLDRPRPSLVYVWSPTPDPVRRKTVSEALGRYGKRRVDLRWVRPRLDDGFFVDASVVSGAVSYAVSLRAETAEKAGERALRRLGISVERIRSLAVTRAGATEPPPKDSASGR